MRQIPLGREDAKKNFSLRLRASAVKNFLTLFLLNVRIWTPPRLQVICSWLLARLHTYIRPLKLAYVDAGP